MGMVASWALQPQVAMRELGRQLRVMETTCLVLGVVVVCERGYWRIQMGVNWAQP